MNRLFGTTPKAPKPTLTSAISGVDARIASLDVKLAALNAELAAHQAKLARLRDGPGKAALRQKARAALQQRKAYEAQRAQLQAQAWGLEQADMLQAGLADAAATVDALQATRRALRAQHGRLDLARIERLQDDMADLLDAGAEIRETLARSYDVPDDVDEAELDAELEALGAEVEMERELGAGAAGEALPSFMQDEVPDFIDEPPASLPGKKVTEAAG